MNIMNVIMLSCVKATSLMEMKEHVPLGLLKTMQLRIHTAICSGCRNYVKQSRLINQLLQKNFDSLPIIKNTDDLEEAIISKLL